MHRNFHVPAGTSARIAVDLRVEDLGARDYTLSGAVYDEQHRSVPMAVQAAGESEDGLPAVLVPQMPVGLWQYELRAGGRPLLHGHLHVLPSPLCGEEGRCNWVVSADPAAEVAQLSVNWQPEPIDYGRVGELAEAAVMDHLYDDRPTPVAIKEMEGSEYVWDRGVEVDVDLDGRAYAVGLYVSRLRYGYEGYVEGETPLYVRLECASASTGDRSVDSQQAVPLGDASACPEGVEPRAGWTYWPLPDDVRLYGGARYTVRLYYLDGSGARVYVPYNLNSAIARHAVVEVYGLCSAPVYPAANTLLEEACARAQADAAAAAAAADRAQEVLAHTQGVAGEDGQSAYDIWLAAGHTGTQDDFLASLKGDAPTAEQMQAAASEMLYEFVPAELSTPAGSSNATCQYIELDEQHVPQGRLVSVSLRSRTGQNPATSSYLALWELGEDGATWAYLGTSTNNPGQTMNTTKSWEFAEGIRLSGRKLRVLAQAERSSVWEVGPTLGVYTTAVPEGDATRVYMNGTAYAFMPELSIAVQQPVPRFAPASHAGDASHLQEDGRKLVIKGAQGNNLLVVRGNETNVSVTGSQMSFNVPQLSAMSDVPVLYRYDMASGASEVWLAGAPDAERLAPMGIAEAGTHVGAPSLPLRLRGSELSFNGAVLDVAGLGGGHLSEVEANMDAHINNASVHVANWERERWNSLYDGNLTTQEKNFLARLVNNSAPPSSTGVLATTDDILHHENDAVAHVTAEERRRWNEGIPMSRISWGGIGGGVDPTGYAASVVITPGEIVNGKTRISVLPDSYYTSPYISIIDARIIYDPSDRGYTVEYSGDYVTISGLPDLNASIINERIILYVNAIYLPSSLTSSGEAFEVGRIEGCLAIDLVS